MYGVGFRSRESFEEFRRSFEEFFLWLLNDFKLQGLEGLGFRVSGLGFGV